MLGRWVNRDPIGEKGEVNLYSFARNQVVNKVDFIGLKTCNGFTKFEITQNLKDIGKTNVEAYNNEISFAPVGVNNVAPFNVEVEFKQPDCGCCSLRQEVNFSPGYLRPDEFKDEEKYPSGAWHEDFAIDRATGKPATYGDRNSFSGTNDYDLVGDKEIPNPVAGQYYKHFDAPSNSSGSGKVSIRVSIIEKGDDCERNSRVLASKVLTINWGQ